MANTPPTPNPGKVKIAQIITRLDWGGAPDIVRILCAGLAERGYEVVLVSGPLSNPSRRTREFLEQNKVRHIVIPALQRDIAIFKDGAALWQLWRVCRRECFDIVHTHTAKAGALGRIAGWLAGVKKIYHTSHGHNFYGYFNPLFGRFLVLLERLLTVCSSRLLVLTEAEKNDLVAYRVGREGKISVIGTVWEQEEASPQARSDLQREIGAPDGCVIIGMVGRLESIKGPDVFVTAAEKAAEKNSACRFVVIGDGSMRTQLETRSRRGILTGRIFFLGWREDARYLIAGLNMLVLASRNEAVGLTLLEAQAQGIPVVATRVGGISDVVQDGVTGFLVEPGDSQALADTIAFLAKDAGLRQRMGEAGKKFVVGRFDAVDFVRKVVDAYAASIPAA